MSDPLTEFLAAEDALEMAKIRLRLIGQLVCEVGYALQTNPEALRAINSAYTISDAGNGYPKETQANEWPSHAMIKELMSKYFEAKRTKAAYWSRLPDVVQENLGRTQKARPELEIQVPRLRSLSASADRSPGRFAAARTD